MNLLLSRFRQARKVVMYCLCAVAFMLAGPASPVLAQEVYPDLVVTSVTGPANSGPGQPISVTFTIVNQGPVNAADFQVGLYLSTDATIATSDILLGNVDVCGLHAGATLTMPVTFTVPQNIASGDYFLGAIANVSGTLVEADTTNNSVASSQKVHVSNAPNPVITSISGSQSAFTEGGATFTVSITNTGFSTGMWGRVYLYLSLTPEITTSSINLNYYGWILPAPYYNSGLAPGQSTTLTVGAQIPGMLAATYYVVAKADLLGVGGHYNNTAVSSQMLQVIGPGMEVTNVSGPQSAHAGDSISVSDTIITKGALHSTAPEDRYCDCYPALIQVTICLYQADRTTVSSCLASFNVGDLGAGGTSTNNTPIVIPAGLAPGTYYLGAVADALVWDDNFPDEVDNMLQTTLVSADPIIITNP